MLLFNLLSRRAKTCETSPGIGDMFFVTKRDLHFKGGDGWVHDLEKGSHTYSARCS